MGPGLNLDVATGILFTANQQILAWLQDGEYGKKNNVSMLLLALSSKYGCACGIDQKASGTALCPWR